MEPRDDHPLLRGIHLLAGLHERRLREDVDATHFHAGRQTIALTIDHWVATELPVPRGGARMHTETLGSVLDRLAQHCALAHAALSSAPKGQVHEAWELLAELALGYQDLAVDLTAGARRLPDSFMTDLGHAVRRRRGIDSQRVVPLGHHRGASIISLSA
ncbi:DUF4254 domain-containing protein [Nocardia asteroides]|uniref:DUF4254 domain-containing protein n=1 Tax=Nocardia asteroides TaxID=1824 RepID=UPI001E2EA046|nr:DUF4254 domain-containing protein [Nocardia asteroides]UGT64715.1 DUF4254 domain-containing protein [Nocardia asteroides]